MNGPGVDLLVVDHRSPGDLRRMLESIVVPKDLGIDLAVWVGLVDCEPSSAGVAREFFADTMITGHVVEWVENIGYNRALNRLGTLGHHPVIGCLNADVVLTAAALPELVTAVITNDQWGVVGPRQIGRNGRLTAGGIFGPQTAPRHRGWKALHGYDDVRDDAVYVAGSALFLRRSLWDELTTCRDYRVALKAPESGPWLDTEHYYGDAYLSLHARAHGYKVVYLGTTTITHAVGGTRINDRDRPDREHFRMACDLHGIDHE